MSDKNLARRAAAQIAFDGVDITDSMAPYLLSLVYTDSEEEEADDLQIKLQDREGIWVESWLEKMINAAVETEGITGGTKYKVTAKGGLNVRSGPGTGYSIYGVLVYGSVVEVTAVKNKWHEIRYNGKTAYVHSDYLERVDTAAEGWAVGDTVRVTGQPMYTSYGTNPGEKVTDYEGTITKLNLVDGATYPIHVSSLGWFAENQVTRAGASPQAAMKPSGFRIQAMIAAKNRAGEGKDSVLDCGQFELDDISAEGPPSTVTIKATALPFSPQIRQTKKTKAWEGYSLSGIAREMAAANGMSCMYLAREDPKYERVEQYNLSDIQFLTKLCRRAGISLKATNNILVLFDQAEYEAAEPVMTVCRGDKSYTKYKLSSGESQTHYTACTVRWTTGEGKVIEGTVKMDDDDKDSYTNQRLNIKAKVSSVAEAEKLAAKLLRLYNKHQKTAVFTMPGDTSLVAGLTVLLEDWGPWSGKYIISEARHTLSSGYTVQIRLRKVLEGY